MNRAIRSSERLDILEAFSPPRVTANMKNSEGLNEGTAVDLTMLDPEDDLFWDLSSKKKEEEAEEGHVMEPCQGDKARSNHRLAAMHGVCELQILQCII